MSELIKNVIFIQSEGSAKIDITDRENSPKGIEWIPSGGKVMVWPNGRAIAGAVFTKPAIEFTATPQSRVPEIEGSRASAWRQNRVWVEFSDLQKGLRQDVVDTAERLGQELVSSDRSARASSVIFVQSHDIIDVMAALEASKRLDEPAPVVWQIDNGFFRKAPESFPFGLMGNHGMIGDPAWPSNVNISPYTISAIKSANLEWLLDNSLWDIARQISEPVPIGGDRVLVELLPHMGLIFFTSKGARLDFNLLFDRSGETAGVPTFMNSGLEERLEIGDGEWDYRLNEQAAVSENRLSMASALIGEANASGNALFGAIDEATTRARSQGLGFKSSDAVRAAVEHLEFARFDPTNVSEGLLYLNQRSLSAHRNPASPSVNDTVRAGIIRLLHDDLAGLNSAKDVDRIVENLRVTLRPERKR